MAPQGSYHAVDFSYNNVPEKEMDQQLVDQPQLEEHLSTTYVDNPDDGGEYERPFRLFLPPNIQTVRVTSTRRRLLTTPTCALIDHIQLVRVNCVMMTTPMDS